MAVSETILPIGEHFRHEKGIYSLIRIVLLAVLVVGWSHRRTSLYLLGSIPILLFNIIWWSHAGLPWPVPPPRPGTGPIHVQCSPLWWGVPVLLYAELTLLLLLPSGG